MTVILELSEEELKKLENITGVDSIETEQDAVQIPVKRCAHSEINGVAIPM